MGSSPIGLAYMVAVAQMVEHRIVISTVVGSSPIGHPKCLVYIDLRGRGPARRDVNPYEATTYNYFDYFCIFICRTQCDRKRGHSDSQRKFPKFIKEFL